MFPTPHDTTASSPLSVIVKSPKETKSCIRNAVRAVLEVGDGVGTVGGVENKDIRARAAGERVVPRAAVERIPARAAGERVGKSGTGQVLDTGQNIALGMAALSAVVRKVHIHRRIGARTFTDMFDDLAEICELYSPQKCWNYFKADGYVSS